MQRVLSGAAAHGCRFSIGVRNSHDKSMRLAMTVGYRVFVCENMAFHGDFQPVLAKHSKNFSLTAAVSVGVDEMQRNFDGMRMQVETWRGSQLADVQAKLIIYRAFIESDLEVPSRSCVPRFRPAPEPAPGCRATRAWRAFPAGRLAANRSPPTAPDRETGTDAREGR